jgi:hypothetical protein
MDVVTVTLHNPNNLERDSIGETTPAIADGKFCLRFFFKFSSSKIPVPWTLKGGSAQCFQSKRGAQPITQPSFQTALASAVNRRATLTDSDSSHGSVDEAREGGVRDRGALALLLPSHCRPAVVNRVASLRLCGLDAAQTALLPNSSMMASASRATTKACSQACTTHSPFNGQHTSRIAASAFSAGADQGTALIMLQAGQVLQCSLPDGQLERAQEGVCGE